MAALLQRAKDHQGHAIDIAMVDSMTRFMTPRLISYLGSGELPRRDGAKESVIAIYQVFQTADEPITLGLGNDAIWKRFWSALNELEYVNDPKYTSNADRRKLRQELVQAIQERLLKQPKAYWLDLFQSNNIPAGPINRLDQISSDTEMLQRGMFYSVNNKSSEIPQVGLGIQIDGQESFCSKPPPKLGADTKMILEKWLNLSNLEIENLISKNIIFAPTQHNKG
jgi:crotonobetainyl-CoA:carnitine CoA-transferase CaiB-like acyl-CoA transferase